MKFAVGLIIGLFLGGAGLFAYAVYVLTDGFKNWGP